MTTTNLHSMAARDRSPLRAVLGMNALTSATAGLVGAIAPTPVGDLLGLAHSQAALIVRVVGIGLVVFAIEVAVTAARYRHASIARDVALISAADIAWVVSTIIVLATVDLSTAGRVLAIVMGVGVAGFALLQVRLRATAANRPSNRAAIRPERD